MMRRDGWADEGGLFTPNSQGDNFREGEENVNLWKSLVGCADYAVRGEYKEPIKTFRAVPLNF